MLEREIERRLGAGLKKLGCLYMKFVSPGNPGVPDRICVTPHGKVWFLELKTDSGRVSDQQKVMLGKLAAMGCNVRVLKGLKECFDFVEEVRTEIGTEN